MYYVYILIGDTTSRWSYVGSTGNLEQRFKDHCAGKVRSTKGHRPLTLIHTETFQTKEEAYKRELYFKSGYGREEKVALLKAKGSGTSCSEVV